MAKVKKDVENPEVLSQNESTSKKEAQKKENGNGQSKFGQWIVANQKKLTIAAYVLVGVAVVAMLAYFMYFKPRIAKAQDQLGMAVFAMAEGNYEQALNGSGDMMGFVALNKEYKNKDQLGMAVFAMAEGNYEQAFNGSGDMMGFVALNKEYKNKPGKLAAVYAGICYYNIGKYNEAIDYLSKCKLKDKVIAPSVKVKIGDCYVALGKYKEALEAYEKAVKLDNESITPVAFKKAGLVYAEQGNKAKALEYLNKSKEAYNKIKDKYQDPLTPYAPFDVMELDMYINSIK